MLNILRKNAQSVVIQGIVVLIAVVFIFWGVGTNLGGSRSAVATVNGEEISYREYQQSYERGCGKLQTAVRGPDAGGLP